MLDIARQTKRRPKDQSKQMRVNTNIHKSAPCLLYSLSLVKNVALMFVPCIGAENGEVSDSGE